MKYFSLPFFALCSLGLLIGSCKQPKPAEINTPAEQVTATESVPTKESPFAAMDTTERKDTVIIEPDTTQSKKKYEHPATNPTKTGDCNVGFNLVSHPSRNSHIIYISGFHPENQKCWFALENYGIQLCGENMPCDVMYVDVADVKKNSSPPFYLDAAFLKTHGIGHFTYKNNWWELKGANIWKRSGKGFDFYNSSRY